MCYHWAATSGIFPIILIYIGGLKVVQSAALLAGLTIAIAVTFLTRTPQKWLVEDNL
jgi:choline-glycine betaine transporter